LLNIKFLNSLTYNYDILKVITLNPEKINLMAVLNATDECVNL